MDRKWWKESVMYQVYPRSFYDSNGDGIGDLRGILEKLDYLQQLGVDMVWLSPVYKSPNDDNGYDISDYREIMPEFGTLDDWRELLDGMHRRGMRLVMDLVVNHTSDEHPWFVEARKGKDNPCRDYYIWRPGKNGAEPNNWASFFGGSAWEYDPGSGEYYLHLFTRKQPDLNWENPRVRQEVYALMRWWLDQGVDGFRMDVINMISKAPGLPDAPVHSSRRYQFGGQHFIHGPRLLEFLDEMKREVLCHYDLFTVGETPQESVATALELIDEESGSLHSVVQFEHMDLDVQDRGSVQRLSLAPWKLADLKETLDRWQIGLQGRGWNSLYLSNHDQGRAVSRFGDDGAYRVVSAKLLATLLHLQQGIPYIYQGEEIGMTNVRFESIEQYRDVETLNFYREAVEERGMDPQAALALIHAKGRDNARTPMQWSAGEQAGFSQGTPWIGVNPNYPQINVEQALADPDSIFYYYQKLIRLRREHPLIVYGDYSPLLVEHPQIYAFRREWQGERLLVMLNFSRESALFELPPDFPLPESPARLLLSNYPVEDSAGLQHITLRPYEGRAYLMK